MLGFFRKVLSSLPDPRRAQGMRYPLVSVAVTALMAMVRGADNAEEMEESAKLFLLLSGRETRFLDPAQIAEVVTKFNVVWD